jgi:hypothetical protein
MTPLAENTIRGLVCASMPGLKAVLFRENKKRYIAWRKNEVRVTFEIKQLQVVFLLAYCRQKV